MGITLPNRREGHGLSEDVKRLGVQPLFLKSSKHLICLDMTSRDYLRVIEAVTAHQ